MTRRWPSWQVSTTSTHLRSPNVSGHQMEGAAERQCQCDFRLSVQAEKAGDDNGGVLVGRMKNLFISLFSGCFFCHADLEKQTFTTPHNVLYLEKCNESRKLSI